MGQKFCVSERLCTLLFIEYKIISFFKPWAMPDIMQFPSPSPSSSCGVCVCVCEAMKRIEGKSQGKSHWEEPGKRTLQVSEAEEIGWLRWSHTESKGWGMGGSVSRWARSCWYVPALRKHSVLLESSAFLSLRSQLFLLDEVLVVTCTCSAWEHKGALKNIHGKMDLGDKARSPPRPWSAYHDFGVYFQTP